MQNPTVAEIILTEDLAKKWPGLVEKEFQFLPNRKYKFDFAIHGKKFVAFEIEGGVFNRKAHGSIEGVLRDMEKYNLAALAGWKVFRFTPGQIERGLHLAIIKKL